MLRFTISKIGHLHVAKRKKIWIQCTLPWPFPFSDLLSICRVFFFFNSPLSCRIPFSPFLMTNYLVNVKPSELFQIAPLFGNVGLSVFFFYILPSDLNYVPAVRVPYYPLDVRLRNLKRIKGLSCAINVGMYWILYSNEMSFFDNYKAHIFLLSPSFGVLLCWHPGVQRASWLNPQQNALFIGREQCNEMSFNWVLTRFIKATSTNVFIISFSWLHERTLLVFWQRAAWSLSHRNVGVYKINYWTWSSIFACHGKGKTDVT